MPPVVYTVYRGSLPNHLKSVSKSCLNKSQIRRLISLWVGWREGVGGEVPRMLCVLFTVASMQLKRSQEVDCHLLQGLSAMRSSAEKMA